MHSQYPSYVRTTVDELVFRVKREFLSIIITNRKVCYSLYLTILDRNSHNIHYNIPWKIMQVYLSAFYVLFGNEHKTCPYCMMVWFVKSGIQRSGKQIFTFLILRLHSDSSWVPKWTTVTIENQLRNLFFMKAITCDLFSLKRLIMT